VGESRVLPVERGGRSASRLAQPLSPREQEVAALIGLGRKNREIAAALVVSERTVHAHVRNLLDKLGLTSRTQIAAWATQHGALQPPASTRAARGVPPDPNSADGARAES
jgi:DNA-binding NarL/FixJ family response regulator